MINTKPLLSIGLILLGFGIVNFFASHGASPTGDLAVAGAVLIAAAKISHSIDEFGKPTEDGPSA